LDDITARLKTYADRSAWDGFLFEAERHLGELDFGDDPYLWVAGGA
jgi:hypothetical protein